MIVRWVGGKELCSMSAHTPARPMLNTSTKCVGERQQGVGVCLGVSSLSLLNDVPPDREDVLAADLGFPRRLHDLVVNRCPVIPTMPIIFPISVIQCTKCNEMKRCNCSWVCHVTVRIGATEHPLTLRARPPWCRAARLQAAVHLHHASIHAAHIESMCPTGKGRSVAKLNSVQ